jgi:hypothetical protein
VGTDKVDFDLPNVIYIRKYNSIIKHNHLWIGKIIRYAKHYTPPSYKNIKSTMKIIYKSHNHKRKKYDSQYIKKILQ